MVALNIYEKLTEVQNELKAPKSKYNSFGKYNYRSCEDILEAVKPILKAKRLAMTVKDDVFNIGDRFYIMATVTVFDCESEEKVTTTAYAREDADKKGMDGSQITGSSSSYARKYALNGMFAIDDTKDADSWNTHDKDRTVEKKEAERATEEQIAKLRALYKGKEDKLTELLDKYGITSPVQFKRMEIQSVIDKLEAKLKQASKE
nr:MAG TPA: ERF superfamily protein [Caudoviricetes sp.]